MGLSGAGQEPRAGWSEIPHVRLSNGARIPMLGIGMDQIKDHERAYEVVRFALEAGYRSIDTATAYGNEADVGRAVADSTVPRDELYISTKVHGLDQGYDATLRAFERSLERLRLDYLDGYLVHWPGKYLYVDTWKALERLYREERVRVIGVCNFNPHHLETMAERADMVPLVNQIEWHPYFQQEDVAEFCRARGIVIEAWSPLMCGGVALADPDVARIAAAHGRTPAQVILRWHTQGGRRVFPKSVTPSRIEENRRIFDFALEDDEVAALDRLGMRRQRIGPDPDIFFIP